MWEKLEDGLFMFRDSCLVYALVGPEGTVLVNAGTGLAAQHLGEVAKGKVSVLLTHSFRDHAEGARKLAEKGAEIYGPYWEQEYLLDPEQHFRERQIWNIYDNRWDRFSPIAPIPMAGWMMDYEKKKIAGLQFEVLPTPGVTCGASTYLVNFNGKKLAFVGELICGHGRMSRMAPLQYDYNDLSGAGNVSHSIHQLAKRWPDRILPSMGAPIDEPAAAIEALHENLKEIGLLHPDMAPGWEPDEDDIEEISPHLFRSKYGSAQTHFVISDSGKVLALDYGYNAALYLTPQRYHQSNRRPLLHGISGLKKRFGIDKIDAVLVSHYHDDHVNGIPMIKRLFGTRLLAAERFADILENPSRYDRPCLWHEPMKVDQALPFEKPFKWENIPITLKELSGHTQFAALLCLEVDGIRVVHTGDQLFFHGQDQPYGPRAKIFTNHVYRNGLDVGCYWQTLKHMHDFKPDLVVTGHSLPYRTDEAWYEHIEKQARNFDEVHKKLMILGDNEAHFGAESQGGKLYPYQCHAPEGGKISFDGWVLNPLPEKAKAKIRLVGPDGWEGEEKELDLAPRARGKFTLTIAPPSGARCRRQPIALDLEVGGRPFGQVTEALITIGCPKF